MKPLGRFLGVDDAPFRFSDAKVRIVGVVTRGASYVEGVLAGSATVDGTDATAVVARMVRGTRFRPSLRCLFLNGLSVGGFNVFDLDALHEKIRIPLVAVARDRPDRSAIRGALRKHFPDWKGRWARIEAAGSRAVPNGHFRVWISSRGLTAPEIRSVLRLATVRGAIPEPLRLAHVIASGVTRGESRGKA